MLVIEICVWIGEVREWCNKRESNKVSQNDTESDGLKNTRKDSLDNVYNGGNVDNGGNEGHSNLSEQMEIMKMYA